MLFDQLVHVAQICHDQFPYFLLVCEWQSKRDNLFVYLQNFPALVKNYKNSEKEPYGLNKQITIVNQIPRIRLSSACEASVNCLYSMAEIASQFGNKSTKRKFPSSFNAFRKKFEKGEYQDMGINKWIDDLQWYRKIRELRTEWVHYSTIYTGEEDNEGLSEFPKSVLCNER